MCALSPAEELRTCEASEDCALAFVDCQQRCSCAAVNVEEVDGIESGAAGECADAVCPTDTCSEDCKERKVASCVRGRCETFDAGDDSGV